MNENCAAADIRLTPLQLTLLDEAAPRGATAAQRYADMTAIGRG
jgi:hypothetical protein